MWLREHARGGAVEDENREVEWVGGGGEYHEHLVDHGKNFCLYFYYYLLLKDIIFYFLLKIKIIYFYYLLLK